MIRLVGDFGGTKTYLAFFNAVDGTLGMVRRYESRAYPSFDMLLLQFLQDSEIHPFLPCDEAVFAIAGTIEVQSDGEQKVTFVNLPWTTTTQALRSLLPQTRIHFCNDFSAAARTCARYAKRLAAGDRPSELYSLNPAHIAKEKGMLAVLGAGTGLGEAFVFLKEGQPPSIFPSEGGHADFAPQDEVEIALLRFLQKRHGGHVSYERILSGAGLVSLYEFFLEYSGALQSEKHSSLQDKILENVKEAPALITQHALQKDDTVCHLVVDRFIRIYGAEAGNLALKMLPEAGIFLCGGIAPKILEIMQQGMFLEQFLSKGRLRTLCEKVPIYIVAEPFAPLWGAAYLEF